MSIKPEPVWGHGAELAVLLIVLPDFSVIKPADIIPLQHHSHARLKKFFSTSSSSLFPQSLENAPGVLWPYAKPFNYEGIQTLHFHRLSKRNVQHFLSFIKALLPFSCHSSAEMFDAILSCKVVK